MKFLKKFNESANDTDLNKFYNEYKSLIDGNSSNDIDILDNIGDLCNKFSMSKDDVNHILNNFDCSFDTAEFLKITYNNWFNDEDMSLKKLVNNITKLDRDINFATNVENMIKKWSNKKN